MVAPPGAGPRPQRTFGRRSSAVATIAGTSPPGPFRCGSTTCRTNPAATAASKALPPRSSIAMPAAEASQWVEATMPTVPRSSGRVVKRSIAARDPSERSPERLALAVSLLFDSPVAEIAAAPAPRSTRWLVAPLVAFALFSLTAGLLAAHDPRSKGYFRLFFSDPIHLKAGLATAVIVLACFQLVTAAWIFRKLPWRKPAWVNPVHRWSG